MRYVTRSRSEQKLMPRFTYTVSVHIVREVQQLPASDLSLDCLCLLCCVCFTELQVQDDVGMERNYSGLRLSSKASKVLQEAAYAYRQQVYTAILPTHDSSFTLQLEDAATATLLLLLRMQRGTCVPLALRARCTAADTHGVHM
jgi:hypothetical protein